MVTSFLLIINPYISLFFWLSAAGIVLEEELSLVSIGLDEGIVILVLVVVGLVASVAYALPSSFLFDCYWDFG